jgi:hypothetical protein
MVYGANVISFETATDLTLRFSYLFLEISKLMRLGLEVKQPNLRLLYKALNLIYKSKHGVCLGGQKLGSAWKILPVNARSLWSWSIVDGKIG